MKIMKIEKRIFWILALCVGYSLAALADNEINIEQTGDNLDLQIDQIGSSNIVQMLDNNSYINSSSLDIWIVQYNFGYENNTINLYTYKIQIIVCIYFLVCGALFGCPSPAPRARETAAAARPPPLPFGHTDRSAEIDIYK